MVHKGEHITALTKRRISESKKGKKFTDEHCSNISKACKGDHSAWKGKHFSEEHKQRLSEAHKGRTFTKEHIRHISESRRGQKYKTPRSEAWCNHLRLCRLKQVFPTKDTSIELEMQDELIRRGIPFEKHPIVCNICRPDIVFSEKKIAVFCDGDYWHNLPDYKVRDAYQNHILKDAGWTVYRFWEHEIHIDVGNCVNRIMVTQMA